MKLHATYMKQKFDILKTVTGRMPKDARITAFERAATQPSCLWPCLERSNLSFLASYLHCDQTYAPFFEPFEKFI
jgi:hypothetical protein